LAGLPTLGRELRPCLTGATSVEGIHGPLPSPVLPTSLLPSAPRLYPHSPPTNVLTVAGPATPTVFFPRLFMPYFFIYFSSSPPPTVFSYCDAFGGELRAHRYGRRISAFPPTQFQSFPPQGLLGFFELRPVSHSVSRALTRATVSFDPLGLSSSFIFLFLIEDFWWPPGRLDTATDHSLRPIVRPCLPPLPRYLPKVAHNLFLLGVLTLLAVNPFFFRPSLFASFQASPMPAKTPPFVR